jgi:uncharacterized protein YecE (DUF72 family)
MNEEVKISRAEGTRLRPADEKRAKKTRDNAKLWGLVKAAVALVDGSRVMAKGVYEISPAAMIALRHHCDNVRFDLKMQELEMQGGGEDDE